MINQLLDRTSFTHLFNFMILGILFPNNYIAAFILGLAWEFLEECITKKEFSRNLLVQHLNDYKNIWGESNKNKLMDIVLNMIGYYIGNRIRSFSPL